ncbi:hypothetical protein TRFO_27139 [Tritrichomonas foetus]|uniref:FAM13A-like domain-containing protein n=1 Tax=Tritrichomonas foetus TaxID=1144522 RepID=A0A1J4K2K9_9EUKA|nr:hypothetical protein TRFO_27139 [Tritrichomonas foetus]|eukprot:OHT05202.1 hypothetical protein TRFO_27139 [Tritrichomonas foetus]
MKKKVDFPPEIFNQPYDSLPLNESHIPIIFDEIIEYFENNKDDFTKHLSKSLALSSIFATDGSYSSDVSDVFMQFIKLLCELPEPFIPKHLIMLYSESPSLTSAQQVIANLQSSKRTLFNRFITLLRDIIKNTIYPLEFDRILGSAFAHQQTHNFFDFLTKQNSSALCFPWIPIKSFLPEEPPNAYPEIEIDELIDYTKVDAEVPPELLVAPSQTVAEQLSELYNNTKLRAKSYGLTDEVLENIDSITIKDAEKFRSELKLILLQFEREIATLIKRKPVKSDKTPLSSLYRLHMRLRNKCRNQSRRDDLIIEKKKLQRELNDFRSEFEEKYGRKISSAADKAPVAAKYQRYKAIKEELAKLSKKPPH